MPLRKNWLMVMSTALAVTSTKSLSGPSGDGPIYSTHDDPILGGAIKRHRLIKRLVFNSG